MRRFAALVSAGVLCGATLVPAATAATAAQLSVTVTPTQVHPQQTYTSTGSGRDGKGLPEGRAKRALAVPGVRE